MKSMGLLWQTLLSVVKMVCQSRRATRLPSDFGGKDELLILANGPSDFGGKDELLILANGPSLQQTVEHSPNFVAGKILLAVNFCVTSPLFERLRPQLYLIADPLFWIVPEKRQQLFGTLGEKMRRPRGTCISLCLPVR